METVVDERGRVLFPRELRFEVGLCEGTIVEGQGGGEECIGPGTFQEGSQDLAVKHRLVGMDALILANLLGGARRFFAFDKDLRLKRV